MTIPPLKTRTRPGTVPVGSGSRSAVQPHTFGVPAPPQVLGDEQTPHTSVIVQPSEITPQFLPWAAHVVGVQPQTLDMPVPPHVCGAAQVPQLGVPPQPSRIVPQFLVPQPVG